MTAFKTTLAHCVGWPESPHEHARVWPLFVFYTLALVFLTVCDGMATALFVKQVGSAYLPGCYAGSAVVLLIATAGYHQWVQRHSPQRLNQRVMLVLMLGLLLASGVVFYQPTWLSWQYHGWLTGSRLVYGGLFLLRELAFGFYLVHFGTLLQAYFTRAELERLLPLIYAGGRLGGLLGGVVLLGWGTLCAWVGAQWLPHLPLSALSEAHGLITLTAFCALVVMIQLAWVHRMVPTTSPEVGQNTASPALGIGAAWQALGQSSPWVNWLTMSAIGFTICRWVLNYQYSHIFEHQFGDAAALAQFVGGYSVVAFGVSLVVQLFATVPLIKQFGLMRCYAAYTWVMVAVMVATAVWPTLLWAILARFVENEVRVGFRNPMINLMINTLSAPLQPLARMWSIGAALPLGTLIASGFLTLGSGHLLGCSLIVGVSYLLPLWPLGQGFAHHEQSRESEKTDAIR